MPLPSISLNFAISADGKITNIERRASTWTSAADSDRLLTLRLAADALLVGRGTLAADDMSLTIPEHLDPPRQPLRCIVSHGGRFDPGHKIFHSPGGAIHLLVTGPTEPAPELSHLATIHRCDLPTFLATLHRDHGVTRLHCEGGGQLARALLTLDLVETIHLTWAGHTVFGGRNAPTITSLPGDFLPASRHFELLDFDPRPESAECFLSYRRSSDDGGPVPRA